MANILATEADAARRKRGLCAEAASARRIARESRRQTADEMAGGGRVITRARDHAIETMTTVEFKGISKALRPCPRRRGSRCRSKSGEFATILGPSGSGKTTILSLLAGIVAPTAGES